MNNDDKFKTNIDDIDLFFHRNFNDLLNDDKIEILPDDKNDAEILDFSTQDKNELKEENIEVLSLNDEKSSNIEILLEDEEHKPEILDLDNSNENFSLNEWLTFDVINEEKEDTLDIIHEEIKPEIIPISNDVKENNINDIEILDFDIDLEQPLPAEINNNQDSIIEDESINNEVLNQKSTKTKNIKKIFLIVDLIILLVLLFLVVLKIIGWNQDNHYTNKQIEEVQSDVVIDEVEDNENTIIVDNNDGDDETMTPNNDYYNFIKEPLISVDFTKLKEKNNDTVGWLQVPGTNINYPVVQSANNEYYLNHSFDKTYNDAGWVFADYRNNLFDDKNLIIYGHARLNLTMFGTLKNVVKSSWYTDSSNHLIKLSTINSNTSWQVFSTYVIEEEDYYIKTFFNGNDEYLNFLNTLKQRSVYNYNVSLNENDRILTLSTCYTDNKRVVLHAKLIKIENR